MSDSQRNLDTRARDGGWLEAKLEASTQSKRQMTCCEVSEAVNFTLSFHYDSTQASSDFHQIYAPEVLPATRLMANVPIKGNLSRAQTANYSFEATDEAVLIEELAAI